MALASRRCSTPDLESFAATSTSRHGEAGPVSHLVHISSSNAGRFEVHPNTWEPVSSLEQAVPARQTLRLGPAAPSHIVLPVMPDDATP